MFDKLIDILRAAWSGLMPFTVVPQTHVAVRLRLGKYWGELAPGLHHKLPFADAVLLCDRRVHFYQTNAHSLRTADGVQVTVKAVMSFRAERAEKAILGQEKFGASVWDGTAASLAAEVIASSYEDLFGPDFEARLFARCQRENEPFGISILTCRLQEIARARTYRVILRE
jgi:regulator of protease activity HflC (stomatin/prohibitin superfamily)